MKRLYSIQLSVFTFLLLLLTVPAWAQSEGSSESSSSTTTTTTKSTGITVNAGDAWYAQPWVWIVGGAVFILLLVALLSGNRNRETVIRDRTTVHKTTERD